jgi:protein gp37
MSDKTQIQWADSTCNPVMGCDGCELWNSDRKSCYAGVQHEMYGEVRLGYSPTFDRITRWSGRTANAAKLPSLAGLRRNEKPWLDGFPRLIFLCDMGDAMSATVPFDWLRMEIVDIVISPLGRRHCWPWLSKRPKRLAEFSTWLSAQGVPWPANLWAGTSITSASTTSRIAELLKVGDEKTPRFVSAEPQLEPLDLRPWLPRLDWVIQGGESGQKPRKFDIAWAQQVYRDCQEAGVRYFLKQLGAYVFSGEERIRLHDRHGGDWTEWPDDAPRVRQMPTQEVTLSCPALHQFHHTHHQ